MSQPSGCRGNTLLSGEQPRRVRRHVSEERERNMLSEEEGAHARALKEGARTHADTASAFEEEAHCAAGRSMEGSGRVRGGKTETSGRLFSALSSSSSAVVRLRWSVLLRQVTTFQLGEATLFFFFFLFCYLHNLSNFWEKCRLNSRAPR